MYGVSVCYGAIYLKRDDEVAVFYLKYKKGGGGRERERESNSFFSLQIYGSNKCKLLFPYMFLSSLYALVMSILSF